MISGKKLTLIVVIFVVAYLGFVIALAPIKNILGFVELPKQVAVVNPKGSLWHGRAESIWVEQVELKNVRWTVNLLSLLTFNPSVDIDFGNRSKSQPNGSLTLRGLSSDLTVSDANVSVAANTALSYYPVPFELQADGDLQLNIDKFVVGQPICSHLAGQLSWPQARVSAMDESVELGPLKADLTCEQGELLVTIDINNNLGLEFNARVAMDKISGQGYLTPGAKFPAEVRPLLSFIGRPDNRGRYRLKI
ncbi:type II secretion system protein N [Thalassotalea aquiviva]|uniref:type II secretion system protein N n=1 Tax=Thalassotalea aquiviva TaxID=3242415 RepID=UPI00352A8576